MARRSGDGRLEEAMANLLASQASLVANQASFLSNQTTFLNYQATFQANFMALTARTDKRFARIEAELSDIRAILLRHEQILQSLPEAIRQKIGFEAQ